MGRFSSRECTHAISKTSSGALTQYRYAGDDLYADYGASLSTPRTLYLQGSGTDEPLLAIDPANPANRRYYHADGLGSLVAVTDTTGALQASRRYDSFGRVLASTGALPTYGYSGREPDASGLMYYRARYYAPELGRFTQADPIGLGGGINRYGYVGGSPVNLRDPSGRIAIVIPPGEQKNAYPGSDDRYDSTNNGLIMDDRTWQLNMAYLSGRTKPQGSVEVPGPAISHLPELLMSLPTPGALAVGGIKIIGREVLEETLVAGGKAAAKEAASLNPVSIRFSQSSVNGVEEIAASMRANGWQGAPINVVRMSDGALTTFDNTRVLAAQRAGIDVQAIIREAGEIFPAGRWTPRSGIQPTTWEDAVRARIQQQNSGFRNTYPNGSPYTGSTQ